VIRPQGNTRLKAARLAAGYRSQQALATALGVGVRQVRRWESASPPWPRAGRQRILTETLGQDLRSLGFVPPGADPEPSATGPVTAAPPDPGSRPAEPEDFPRTGPGRQPGSVAEDFLRVTRLHRALHRTVAPATLHPAVAAHAALGSALLPETGGGTRRRLAAAVAETWLLCGRIELAGAGGPRRAGPALLRAMRAAREAGEPLLGAAVLAHTAGLSGREGHRDEETERLAAARSYARRGRAGGVFLAWLDLVEAEGEERHGDHARALELVADAEERLRAGAGSGAPEWMDWFGPGRLSAFKGEVQLGAGLLTEARATLLGTLALVPEDEPALRRGVYGHLAAVEAAGGDPEAACSYACRALDLLESTWYTMGMDRVREVRRSLLPHTHEECVRDLEEKLHGWATTIRALSR
jgi:transcriptional regulator with XRE-family HTH domain